MLQCRKVGMALYANFCTVVMPKMLIQLCILYAYMKGTVLCVLHFLGLRPLCLDFDLDFPINEECDNDCEWESSCSKKLKESMPCIEFWRTRASERRLVSEEENALCTICLASFEDSHHVREIRDCFHVFHRDCIDGWLDHGHITCPLCRGSLLFAIYDSSMHAVKSAPSFLDC